jgi:sporulation protein YlmC with PRC-barrel domain
VQTEDHFSVAELLLDRQIFDVDGEAIGKVDDIELTENEGGPPVLTAILCGPLALGPRIGGPLGRWWAAIGRRYRPGSSSYPTRIPMNQVGRVDRREVRLTVSRDVLDADRFRDWVRDHIIGRIPGSST